MSELRVTLLIVGVLFIVALTWWELRRPRQASRAAAERLPVRDSEPLAPPPRAPREPTLTLPEMRAREPVLPHELPVVELSPEHPPEQLASSFELPASHAAVAPDSPPDAEQAAPGVHGTAAADAAAGAMPDLQEGLPGAAEARAAAAPALTAPPVREELPRLPPVPSPVVEWPPDAQRQIVSLRLVAMSPERFVGRSLRQALAAEGFVLGRFAIFHKPDEEQRAVLSAASLTRPGTFDPDTMDSQHFGGLSLFTVLPGPRPAPQAFEELISAARNLNDRLQGVLQDERGAPLTSTRIALLRERINHGSLS